MKEALIGLSVDSAVCESYDDLNLSEFKEIVEYLNTLYCVARNKKNVSSFHGRFGASSGGYHARWKYKHFSKQCGFFCTTFNSGALSLQG
jgi:hypothetical protein